MREVVWKSSKDRNITTKRYSKQRVIQIRNDRSSKELIVFARITGVVGREEGREMDNEGLLLSIS